MNFSAATIAERTPAGQRQSVESESKIMVRDEEMKELTVNYRQCRSCL
jgi:hypothetical protein